MIVKRGHSASTPGARLDLPTRSREHFTVLVPRVIPGTKEGTRTLQIRTFEFAEIRGCPRNCERRALGPTRPLGNWEGRTTKAITREPGDLPAQSPNRWAGRPYGAVFRSGDGNAGAKDVRAQSTTTFRTEVREFLDGGHRVYLAPGLVFTLCVRKANANEGTFAMGRYVHLLGAISALAACLQTARAQDNPQGTLVLPTVVVSPTTVPTPQNEIASSVTVITAAD